jgi:hypothetical protein
MRKETSWTFIWQFLLIIGSIAFLFVGAGLVDRTSGTINTLGTIIVIVLSLGGLLAGGFWITKSRNPEQQ